MLLYKYSIFVVSVVNKYSIFVVSVVNEYSIFIVSVVLSSPSSAMIISSPCPIPIECRGQAPVEKAVVLMRVGALAPVVNQAGARRCVVVVGELLPVRHGWGGELVPLHLLLL